MGKPTTQLSSLIQDVGKRGVVVLTGAGCSTESGIPDYRGPQGKYRRADFVPLTFQKFMSNDLEKKRYWTRSMLGYAVMTGASCNPTHIGLHLLERSGIVSHILTQNVDGLHHLAVHGGQGTKTNHLCYTSSSAKLTELHGNIHLVMCVNCKKVTPRDLLQKRLEGVNASVLRDYTLEASRFQPDGDYIAPESLVESLELVHCDSCGGYLKPHVVLFGENVSKDVVQSSLNIVKSASCLICVGTSLQVFSAYRYVLAAKEAKIPVVIVNSGKTRADGQEDLRIETTSVAEVIAATSRDLLGGDGEIRLDKGEELNRSSAIHTYS